MLRRAQVAGQFYPASPLALKKELAKLIEEKGKKEEALGIIVPHAGYIYSGKVAADCFSSVQLTKRVVILGPNHTGEGARFSIMSEGTWQMPLGDVPVDAALAKRILQASAYLEEDVRAHLHEHSIEVELPFLQYFLPELKIVPIILSDAEPDIYDEIGLSIAQALKELKEKCLIIASTDMTHYEPQEEAKRKDNLAIQSILKLDEKELLQRIQDLHITMCGYAPVLCLVSAAKALGANQARLIKYQTSGETSGDYSSVVGYAGILVK